MKIAGDVTESQRINPRSLVVGVILGLVAISLADRMLWEAFRVPKEFMPTLSSKDWYQVLRQAGYLPTWIIVAASISLFAFHAKRMSWWIDGATIALAAALSGAVAEILKVIVMRQRPGDDGVYRFAWFLEHFDKGPGFGMPSSHAAVAFGGAFAVSYLYRGSCWIMIPLATGCGITRLLAGAHFASDVYVAAIIGWIISKALLSRARALRQAEAHTVKVADAND